MSFHLARKNFRFLFNVLAIAFTIGYFISILSYTSPHAFKGTTKPLLQQVEQSSYLAFTSGKQTFSKIPAQFVGLISFKPSAVQTHLRNHQNFFISIFERNVFYVHITIHAP